MKKSKFSKGFSITLLLLGLGLAGAGLVLVTSAYGGRSDDNKGIGPKCGGPENTCWQRAVDVSNPGAALKNYQVKATLDTKTLVKRQQLRSDCADLRFTSSDGVTLLNHWLEDGCNSDSTNIWVKVPSLAAAAETTIYANYGNSKLADASDFNGVFPNSYILRSGSDAASGPLNYDWFEIKEGTIFNVQEGAVQEINARKIIIAGILNGSGLGFDGAVRRGSGKGPGAGSYKSGAGYGGAGGQGQRSAWGAAGTPGAAYGSASSQDIQMGSGGGASDNIQAPGGAGGGAVSLLAAEIQIPGTIIMNGSSHRTGTNQNGGGSGGGILIFASRVDLSGFLSASGGAADNGTVRAGGAGGGGGGRIKIFSDKAISDTSAKNVSGGVGSPGGTNGGSFNRGGDGAEGSVNTGAFALGEPTVSVSERAKRLDTGRDDDKDD